MTALKKFTTLNELTVTGKQTGPHLLITSGIHGDEFEPMEASRRVFNEVESLVMINSIWPGCVPETKKEVLPNRLRMQCQH
jgi:hypothetical protein